jgi:DNA-binding transcriptional LysR family regulator
MTLNQLYYFRKVAELQHFTQSATELFISQPSLSYSISNLEKELGIPLFQKRGKKVILTNHGKEFYQCVVEVLTKLEDGVAALKDNIDSASYKINIGALPIFPSNFISRGIRAYLKSHPQTKFDIFTCIDNKDVINGIYDGEYDFGFCYKEEQENDLVFVPMLRQELVVIAKTDHELSKKKKVAFSDLQEYPLISYRENHPLGIYIRSLLKEQNIFLNFTFAFDEDITICEMVAQDLGVAILNNIPILSKYLSVIPLDLKSDQPILYLAYHRNSIHLKANQKFIQLLKTKAVIQQIVI